MSLDTHYTSGTAPDLTSRALLASPLYAPWQGASKGMQIGPYVTHNFSRIVAQNFAAQSPERLARYFATASRADLMRLGQAYADSLATNGTPPWALDVLAARLSPEQLARLCPLFGFHALAESVSRAAANQYSLFVSLAPKVSGPVAFARGLESLGGEGPGAQAARNTNYLDMTIEQIYTSFRTAPHPAGMSVKASLYSTASVLTRSLSPAFGTGFAVGSALVWGAQRFAPGFWGSVVDGFGGFLYDIEDAFDSEPSDPIHSPEEQAAALQERGYFERMRMPHEEASVPGLLDHFRFNGGSYGETHDWAASNASTPPLNPCLAAGSCDTGGGNEQ
jgi:hypothetical protein